MGEESSRALKPAANIFCVERRLHDICVNSWVHSRPCVVDGLNVVTSGGHCRKLCWTEFTDREFGINTESSRTFGRIQEAHRDGHSARQIAVANVRRNRLCL